MSDFQHSAAKPHGTLIITTPEKVITADTLRCVHCQKVWVVVKGSGIRRNFCTRCMGPTCGEQRCEPSECMNWEKRLELYEDGKISSI